MTRCQSTNPHDTKDELRVFSRMNLPMCRACWRDLREYWKKKDAEESCEALHVSYWIPRWEDAAVYVDEVVDGREDTEEIKDAILLYHKTIHQINTLFASLKLDGDRFRQCGDILRDSPELLKMGVGEDNWIPSRGKVLDDCEMLRERISILRSLLTFFDSVKVDLSGSTEPWVRNMFSR